MILREIAVYEEKFNNYLPKETRRVLHYKNIEAVENEDLIIINTGQNTTAYKVFDLDELQKDPLKMKLTSYEGETKVVSVHINKIHFNIAGDQAVKLEFKVLEPVVMSFGGAGIYSLL